MIELRPFSTLGHANHGWLDARHHFCFAGYQDPARMNWGRLRVWNDDVIAPGAGFPPHSHQDMEIITYVRRGAISHRDHLGNQGRTVAGDIQVMSAGSNVTHSEFNAEAEPCHLFQIWIFPDQAGGPAAWAARQFPAADRTGRFTVLASGMAGDDDALPIRADARLVTARLAAGQSATYAAARGRHLYLVPASGSVEIGGIVAAERDGVAISGESEITVTAVADADVVMVDTRG